MYNLKLWETSGHAAKYKENMFCIDIEGQEFGLKPMNCPVQASEASGVLLRITSFTPRALPR
mgnify:FL=1